jgi:hypothetical protein
MILECYQCSSCYFEETQPSSRIDPSAISAAQGRRDFQDVILAFVCVEIYDGQQELRDAVEEFTRLSDMIGRRGIVLCPNVHLSMDRAPEHEASSLMQQLDSQLQAAGFEVHALSFGYHKQFGMECRGNVGSVVGRRFYGTPEKQFLRLLARLGLCPGQVIQPGEMPAWAQVLFDRQLKVMVNRKETYKVARSMLKDQLDTNPRSELWTCMLFEGERQPMEDYLSTLHQIIESYPDVRIHRALNLSVPGFANAARHLFRRYPEALESGQLRIYNSTVRDIEFLLTSAEVLLAFPQNPPKAGLHAGQISFGIYCKDADFARNVIGWYKTFLVDGRFGWIRTESQLDTIINELEEETFQRRR